MTFKGTQYQNNQIFILLFGSNVPTLTLDTTMFSDLCKTMFKVDSDVVKLLFTEFNIRVKSRSDRKLLCEYNVFFFFCNLLWGSCLVNSGMVYPSIWSVPLHLLLEVQYRRLLQLLQRLEKQ